MSGSDRLRLAVGALSTAPVPAASVDRRAAGRALAWAPLVGAALGALAAALLEGVRQATHHSATGTLLAAVVAVAALAATTGGLHPAGLAGTADALGSRLGAGGAVAVPGRSDAGPVGPAGVVSVVLVLALQVAAVGESVSRGSGWLGLVVSVATGRLAAGWGCRSPLRSAGTDGLATLAAGTVRTPVLLALSTAVAAGAAGLNVLDDDPSLALAVRSAAAVLVGLAFSGLVLHQCRRRPGGVTGEVLGAVVECATTAALLVFALG